MAGHTTEAEVITEVQPYWSFTNKVVDIDGIMMKGRRAIIPASRQKRALNQLHVNHMGTEKTRLLVHEFVY